MIIATITCIIFMLLGFLLSINGAYQYLFLSSEKISSESIKYGNYFLYVDLSMYIFLGMLFTMRGVSQGVGKPFITFMCGVMELIARILVAVFLPALINGGPINSLASDFSYVMLCFADPIAWIFADVVLFIPYFKHIRPANYDYFFKEELKISQENNEETTLSQQTQIVTTKFDTTEIKFK